MTAGLMKKFTVTTAHIVNTLIPMTLDAVTELQVHITLQHLHTYHKRIVTVIKGNNQKQQEEN
jgi:hypothetical protein